MINKKRHYLNDFINIKHYFFLLSFFSFIIFFFSYSLFAGEVVKVKGKSVLLSFDSGDGMENDKKFYLVNISDKKTAIIKIKKIKGNKALAVVLKGRASAGNRLKEYSSSSSSSSSSKKSSKDKYKIAQNMYWGVLGGMNSTSMDITLSTSLQTSPAGMSYNFKGIFDYYLSSFESLSIRALSGMYNIDIVEEVNYCLSDVCGAQITYLSLDGILRWMLLKTSSMGLWLGGGLSLVFPLSKSSNSLNEENIQTNYLYTGCIGLDYHLNSGSYFTVQAEYNMFPSSTDVTASSMSFNLGYVMPF